MRMNNSHPETPSNYEIFITYLVQQATRPLIHFMPYREQHKQHSVTYLASSSLARGPASP